MLFLWLLVVCQATMKKQTTKIKIKKTNNNPKLNSPGMNSCFSQTPGPTICQTLSIICSILEPLSTP